MNLGFTGHRNKLAQDADIITLFNQYPTATIIHGGAKGFDSQVNRLGSNSNRNIKIYHPNYRLHGKKAPFIRNIQIVNESDMLIACYDGRLTGGTYYTIIQAQKAGKQIIFLKPHITID